MKVCSLLLSVLLHWNFSIYSVFDSCVIAYSLKVVSPTNIATPHFGMKECISNYPHALIFAKVHAVVLSKKHQRNSTVQEELTNDGIHPQVHDKICIAETLHVYRNRAGPAMCEMSVFSREISQLSKMRLPHSLRSLSSFIAQKKHILT